MKKNKISFCATISPFHYSAFAIKHMVGWIYTSWTPTYRFGWTWNSSTFLRLSWICIHINLTLFLPFFSKILKEDGARNFEDLSFGPIQMWWRKCMGFLAHISLHNILSRSSCSMNYWNPILQVYFNLSELFNQLSCCHTWKLQY